MSTNTNDPSEFGMFAPTSAADAANQSNPNRGIEVIVDILKPSAVRHTWEEGDNWMRFINTRGQPWFQDVTYYEMRSGNKVARVAHQDQLFGDVNLLLAVQIGLYTNPATRPLMGTRENPKGFKFRDHRKAFALAARWENALSPFGVVSVTLGRPSYGKGQQKYKEAWGDNLIKIPAELTVDPTLPMEQSNQPVPRWGSIFDPVDGRLIKCSFTNYGTVDISASFTPAEKTMPLGDWVLADGRPAVYEADSPTGAYRRGDGIRPVPAGSSFKPRPQYLDILRSIPNLRDSFRRISIDEQIDLLHTFIPAELLPYAEQIIQTTLAERGNRKSRTTGATVPASVPVNPTVAEPVQLPVPADEPPQRSEGEKLYLECVRELGPQFKLVGEEVVRKLIKLSLVNPANVKQMAAFQPDLLKTLASSS